MGWFEDMWRWITGLLNGTPAVLSEGQEALQVVMPRVLVINFDPVVNAQGKRLTEKMGWSNVGQLIDTFIKDVDEVSHGLVKYQFDPVNRLDVDAFPMKKDGFRYTPAQYLAMMQQESSHHEPDGVDYWQILNEYGVLNRVMANEIDEVWLFGGPYFGFWESHMVGKGAIWCNSAPLANSDHCTRRFVVMGFNYQRGAAEMLHNVGHRAESILAHVHNVFGRLMKAYGAVNPAVQPPIGADEFNNPRTDFERFLLYEKIAPGRAGCGLIHTPPNANKDYDWQNPMVVTSTCDAWMNFPQMDGAPRQLNCAEWNSTEYGFIKWWFKHMPHVAGSRNGILNNWWRYVIQVDLPFRST